MATESGAQSISLMERIDSGEDSQTQFKENIFEARKLAEEMAAFSNAEGGVERRFSKEKCGKCL